MKAKVYYFIIFTIEVFNQKATNWLKPDMVARPLFYPSDVENETYDDLKVLRRKYCGRVSFEQLIEFIDKCGFTNTCKTMGALTIEYGWMDAISFEVTGQDVWQDEYCLNAYIAPIYDDQFFEQFNDLSKEHQQMVWSHMKKVMDWLENDAIENYYEIKNGKTDAPKYLSEKYFDFQQLTIPKFE